MVSGLSVVVTKPFVPVLLIASGGAAAVTDTDICQLNILFIILNIDFDHKKKPTCTKNISFGSSAIFLTKIHSFPSLSHGRFGFIEKLHNILKIYNQS